MTLPLLCLLLTSAFPSVLHAQEHGNGPPADVVINEVFYAPARSGLEFVELFNRSQEAVDLRLLHLGDSRREPVAVSIQPFSLPATGYAVLVRSAADFAQAFSQVDHVEVSSWPALNNSGDIVTVYFSEHGDQYVPLDSVSYGPNWAPRGVSLERRDPNGPATAANFGPSAAAAGATPGSRNSIYDPDRRPPEPLFAEQESPHMVLVYFDERLDAAALASSSFHLPSQHAVQASLAAPSKVRLRFAAAVSGAVLTMANVVDAAGNASGRVSLPLAHLPDAGELIVSELLYAPLTDDYDAKPNQPEYVELFNRSDRLLTLHDLYVTNRPNERGEADTLRASLPPTSLPPGGYAVIFSEPDSVSDPAVASTLALAFPDLRFSGSLVRLLPVRQSSLALSNEGDRIVVHRRDGVVIDSLTYHPNWHHPAMLEPRGIALERISPDAASHESTSWTSSANPHGGTPGGPNSVQDTSSSATADSGLQIAPSPFSPDGDGVDDYVHIQYRLAQQFALVRARIYDHQGRLVRTLTEGTASGHAGELIWDGRDDGGHPLRLGIYIVLVEAVDAESGSSEAHKDAVVLARSLN